MARQTILYRAVRCTMLSSSCVQNLRTSFTARPIIFSNTRIFIVTRSTTIYFNMIGLFERKRKIFHHYYFNIKRQSLLLFLFFSERKKINYWDLPKIYYSVIKLASITHSQHNFTRISTIIYTRRSTVSLLFFFFSLISKITIIIVQYMIESPKKKNLFIQKKERK